MTKKQREKLLQLNQSWLKQNSMYQQKDNNSAKYIAVWIGFILLLLFLMWILGKQKKAENCEWYRFTPINDVPASCYSYFK